MFQNVLRESWVYQEIGQEFFEEGREEERQRSRQRLYDAIMSLVQMHFPELVPLAEQQTTSMTDPHTLQKINLQLIAAQPPEEAKQILLVVNKS